MEKQTMAEHDTVVPVLPEDVNTGKLGPAPPSYEEVMGQYVTSVKPSQSAMPSLAYIDIMPRLIHLGDIKNKIPPTFQPFTDIIGGANVWLRDNPGLSVWKCETVERKVNPGDAPGEVKVELENMCHHESTYGFNCYVFGLRLWLTQKPAGQTGVLELGLHNILPTPKEVAVHMYNTMGMPGMMGMSRRGMFGGFGIGQFMTMTNTRTFLTYEGLKRSIQDFNSAVQSNPIPGTVLNIESTTLKFGEGFRTDSTANVAEASSWHEVKGNSSKRFTQVLRLFYVKGSPTTPQIKMEEFLPSQLSEPVWDKPVKFGSFQEVLSRAAAWIQNQAGIKIVNIETREAKLCQSQFTGVDIETDTTDDIAFGMFNSSKLRFLRIFYIPDHSSPPFAHVMMTSRLFVPLRLGPSSFESMTETMTRIDAWMKLTGLPIFGVETVTYLKSGSASGVDDVKCDFTIQSHSTKHWVTAIRVYFPAAFQEPPAELLPPSPKGKSQSSSCSIL